MSLLKVVLEVAMGAITAPRGRILRMRTDQVLTRRGLDARKDVLQPPPENPLGWAIAGWFFASKNAGQGLLPGL